MNIGYSKDITASKAGLKYEPTVDDASRCGAGPRVKREFERLDLNRDGTITSGELQQMTPAQSSDLGIVLSALKTPSDTKSAASLLKSLSPETLRALISREAMEDRMNAHAGTLKDPKFVALIRNFAQENPTAFQFLFDKMSPEAQKRVQQALPEFVRANTPGGRVASPVEPTTIDGPGGEIRIAHESPLSRPVSRLVALSKDPANGVDATLQTDQSIVFQLRGQRFRVTDPESQKQADALEGFINRLLSPKF